ncbi:MAG TPA: hypothetical protein VK957_17225 [Lunatimonas sp.]|nr:hypothetical protein [Lunatimonas sp.]
MIKIPYYLLIFATVCLIACSPKPSQEETLSEIVEEETTPEVPITVTVMPSEAFPDAMIELYRPLGNETFSPGKVPFEFNIKNYPFGQQRPLMIAINGGDPQAYPQAVFSKEFNAGTYRAVAFLTDENGMALKEFGNFVDRDFLVGQSRPFPAGDEPYLMVNFPRQNQEYTFGDSVVVDFLVVGGDLKLDGLGVEVKVGDLVYKASSADAIKLENLSVGEYVVRIDLVKNDGSELSNIFASASRRVVVK